MLNKIFAALLGISIVTMAILTFLPYNQLQSIGFAPAQIVESFNYYENIHWLTLLFSSAILLIFANVILWITQKSWALSATFIYFAVTILVNTWWLTELLAKYQAEHNLQTAGLISKNGIFGAILCVVVGIGVFFDQFLVLRLREKMYPKPLPADVDQNEIAVEETPPLDSK